MGKLLQVVVHWYRSGAMLEVLLMPPAAQMRTKVVEMIGASCRESMAAWTQCNRSGVTATCIKM